MDKEKRWYALYVPNGKEEEVKQVLESQFGNRLQFVIMRRKLQERKAGVWREVNRKLFPGYVLVKGKIDKTLYHEMKNKVARLNFLRDVQNQELLTIDERELAVLDLLTQETENLIEISSLYMKGSEIQIIDGPLMGLEGLIVNVNARKGRVKVNLDFIGEKRMVELGVRMVKKA